ncbi:hypothetical protein [Pseudotabrizicola alkalilacus]|nr:hypothetical protein [Pseudotabrizicola alkalilacus]
MSASFGGAEIGKIRIGGMVAVFGRGPLVPQHYSVRRRKCSDNRAFKAKV